MKRLLLYCVSLTLMGCVTDPDRLTLAQLAYVEADLTEVDVTHSLELAMQGYREFLANTEVNRQTPEALRRLADLKIEKEFGTHVGSERIAPEPVGPERVSRPDFSSDGTSQVITQDRVIDSQDVAAADLDASMQARSATTETVGALALDAGQDFGPTTSTSPREAIAIYQRVLRDYPHYARNDQVLYQMARAYDELAEPEQAMQVMDRLVGTFPQSRFIDEVRFREGEFYFVRRKYLEAEEAYGAIIAMGKTSTFYELARYKMGWSLYKQELYEDALHHYLALLDYKVEQGYDFTASAGSSADSDAAALEEERRVADTFRVVSLAFSNVGGAETLKDYFADNGHRSYESRIYQNLAEFYVEKLRFNDAAEVYASFVDQNPLHLVAPQFSMRVTEIYAEGGFPQLVVASKKDFAQRYGLSSAYWQQYAIADMPEVLGFLKTNLQDLAQHYHAVYQDEELVDERPANYVEAGHWYGEFIASFPQDEATPGLHYRLADLHLEQGAFALAAQAYEHTAYEYPAHDRSAEAGYAGVFAHRERLAEIDNEAFVEGEIEEEIEGGGADVETGAQNTILREAVASSLRFAGTFPDHEEAAPVLGRATDDLYGLGAYTEAIAAGTLLVQQHAAAEITLRRRAWTVISHAHFDLAQFADAETSYLQVLNLLTDDADERSEIVEALAASIYQQGELARAVDDHALAAEHFLRVKTLAPDASIRPEAEYDAAAALVALAAWDRAADVLNDFRAVHAEHALQGDVTKQLANVYRESGQHMNAAQEYRRIADSAEDPEQRSESLLLAGEFFQKADAVEDALAAYGNYVDEFSEPLEANVETRQTIAELLENFDPDRYLAQLGVIVTLDAQAGPARTDRTRYLAAHAALVLAEPAYEYFTGMDLVLPFEASLKDKQARMDKAMAVMENLVTYQVAGVTAAATFYMAEIYRNFSDSLMQSERPQGLSGNELAAYDMVLEEEAYPFEERAMEVHLANLELMRAGTHNDWVEKSLSELKVLNPARYDKQMASAGYLRAIDTYAYRSPLPGVLVAAAEAASEAASEVAVGAAALPDQASVSGMEPVAEGGLDGGQ